MGKNFITDLDIESQAEQGIKRIFIDENTVITDLAYEKANRLGIELLRQDTESPPSAPVRPYLNAAVKKQIEKEAGQVIKPLDLTPESQDVLTFDESTDEAALKAAIIKTGKILYDHGLMVSNDGNISVRMGNGNVIITPSGVTKGRITVNDLLVIDLEGNLVKSASNPNMKPTSEQAMHLEVYRQRPDVNGIIHTHLIYANALAISHGQIRMDVIPEAAIAFGDIPLTEFSMPSTPQNAEAIRSLIKDNDVMLIRNHGSLCVGKDLNEALINTERLEHVSKTLTFAELLGEPNKLPQEMLDKIAEIVSKPKA